MPAAFVAAAACAPHAHSAPDVAPLVGRLLLAEDRRDSTDAAIAEGLRSADERVRVMARRAVGRIRDPRYAARDSLPSLAAPRAWTPEPAWRLRFRALTRKTSCDSLHAGLTDASWQVRMHAADLLTAPCADAATIATLRSWIASLPTDASRRAPGQPSWHPAAHAVVALATLDPGGSSDVIRLLASHAQAEVRTYAARAAERRSNTTLLRALALDRDDNVKEAAIDALSRLTGHAADSVYVAALDATGAQAVRAAANALKGSPRPDVRDRLNATFERWAAHANDSERDARVALLEAAGRLASDDRPPPPVVRLPPRAVDLALGADVRLRVTMSDASGGGAFVVRLRGDVAPMMAARVLELVRSGYYDGGHWHRVEPDFVIQGAGPGTNEYVGYAHYFRDELGTVPHMRGTVGMSTRGHDSGDAQWFINLKDNLRLNADYSVFAELVEGIEVVDGILEGDRIATVREIAVK